MARVVRAAGIALAVSLGFSGGAPRAETITFAVGEWAPYISEIAIGYGPHSERVARVFAQAGYDVEFDFMIWKRAYELTRRGDYVATFSWFPSESRRRDMLFPQTPVYQNQNAVFYNVERYPDGPGVRTIEDIKTLGLRPVAINGYWIEAELRAIGVEAHRVSHGEFAWRMLARDRVDIHVEDPVVAAAEKAELLDPEAAAKITQGAILRTEDMFVLFSRIHSKGPELRAIWDRHAPLVLN